MHRPAAGEARGWVVPYIAALFAMMMLQVSNLGFPPLLPGIEKSWGLSFSQVGLITGVNGLSSMLMAIPAGLLIERFGEKKVLRTGLFVVAIGLVVVAASSSFPMGMVGRSIWQAGFFKGTWLLWEHDLELETPFCPQGSGYFTG